MAGSAARKDKSKSSKKRKTLISDELSPFSKVSRRSYESCQWRNLDIVLSTKNKEITVLKKVELVFDFVKSRGKKEENDPDEDFNVLSISQLLLDISDWIQSLLLTSEKKIRAGEESEESQLYLDYRCWEIFKFCLKESLGLHVSLRLSRDLLRVISCVAKSALKSVNSVHIDDKDSTLSTVELQFFDTVNDCIELIFSSHGQLSNEKDVWTMAVTSVLELIIKIYRDNLLDNGARNIISRFSCLVFEPFSKFLRLHPNRKNGFRDFVDKLLEPLLPFLGVLHDKCKDDPVSGHNLFKLVEEMMCYGLFHSMYLDEYLSIQSTDKYNTSTDCQLVDARTIIKSYHRHLFKKMECFVLEGKRQSLSAFGDMFKLFIDCVRNYKRDSPDAEKSKVMESQFVKLPSKMDNLTSMKHDQMISLSSEMRKSVFSFFVVTLEPLLIHLKKHLQCDFQADSSLLDVYYALKSVNKIVSVMMRERVYLRIQGDCGGACLNFFKIIYGLMLSCYAKINQLWQSTCGTERFAHAGILNSIAKEFIVVVGNFLEIEYEVIGDELVNTWIMILTFSAMAHFSDDATLFAGTVDLGCRVLGLYSELRQVNLAVFTLCKGLRHLSFYQGDDEINNSPLLTADSLHQDKFAKSSHLLLCSQKFRLAICNAIKSIPEGQVSGYAQDLADDVSDSLTWLKLGSSVADEFVDTNFRSFSAQADIFGLVLSEIYSIVLESLSVTAGNSYLVGVSIKKLVKVLHPSVNHLVSPEQGGTDEFLFSVTGRNLESKVEFGNSWQDRMPLVILFFFRLYMSCRSIYRQAVSLMPPDSSRKMSGVMADFYTAYSGQDCVEMTDFEDDGYFSWTGRPSASLLSVMQLIKDRFLQENSLDHSCLIYVMHAMTFQRLVDVGRQVQSLEYIVQRSENMIQSELLDATDLLIPDKKRFLSSLKEEAVDLTGFITQYLPLVHNKQLPSELCRKTEQSSSPQHMDLVPWDMDICTVNEKTLPTAIWWIVCQNIDIWCNHASKKKLKLFLSLLISNSLPYGNCAELVEHLQSHPGEALKVTKHQISLQHLCDTKLYEQTFVCRYMASTICDSLKKCILLLFEDSRNIDAELSSTDWTRALSVLHNLSMATRDKSVTSRCTYSDQIEKCCEKQASFSQISLHVASCRRLLNLMCQTMERSLSVKSFSRYATYLVNFERLVIGSLFDPRGKLCLHEHHTLLGLLVSCRKALKYLLMAFFETKSGASKSTDLSVFSGSSSPTQWLLKSVDLVVAWRHTISSENNVGQVNDLIFSLMDHTSYVFFTLSKYQSGLAIQFIMRPKNAKSSCPDCGGSVPNECACMTSSNGAEACNHLTSIVETFEEQTKSILVSLRESFSTERTEVSELSAYLNNLSSLVSCIRGVLWGLESTLSNIGASKGDFKAKLMKRKHQTLSGINNLIDVFVELICISSGIFLHSKKGSQSMDSGIDALTEFGSFNHNCLRVDLLQSCLNGQNPEVAFFVRGFFIASSAIMKLNTQMGSSPLPSNLIQILMACSEVLLKKFSCMVDTPKPSSFVWLDGTVKFLETSGSHFLSNGPDTTREIYTKLVLLHLKAVGRCISLQGKEATLASHDIDSSTKVLRQKQASDLLYCLDELKTRLRMSVKVLMEDSSEEHMLCAVEALERSVVGVREGCTSIYEVKRESIDGGSVSPMVAAGIDCLDLFLDFVKGKKRLDLVKSCMNNLIAALLNIIVHLQGPTLYYKDLSISAVKNNPDSGAVVLMCVEVFTRVAAKPALFHLGSNYIGQSMHIPVLLFQGFCNLRAQRSSCSSLLRSIDSKESEHPESCFLVDRQFSMSLYAASCRLLWTLVKHHKSECGRCISLLQISLQSLLHCLEIVGTDSEDRKGYFSWLVEEGVECASYLRRVYEEIRQQRDVSGRHFMFLSDYIMLYSGLGPLKRGIKREVDEALRPGIYALVDVCSPDDLQYLHTVFGEGPCRSTLASLQHDYKLHFQYEGKV